MIQKETTMKLDCITAQSNMGTRTGTCRLAAESRKRLAANRAFAQGGRNNIEKGNIKWLTPSQQTLALR